MHVKFTKTMQKHSFWIALLCHVLLFLSFVLTWNYQFEIKERPSLYIPSYVYREQSNPAIPQKNTDSSKDVTTSPNGIEKPAKERSHVVPSANQLQEITSSKSVEGVHLIGDKQIDNKLLELLGKALTAHLVYPKSAIDFNVKGTSMVGFTVWPNGNVTDIQLVESSGAEVLDKAALVATHAISPVKTISPYVKQAQYLIIGFVFS